VDPRGSNKQGAKGGKAARRRRFLIYGAVAGVLALIVLLSRRGGGAAASSDPTAQAAPAGNLPEFADGSVAGYPGAGSDPALVGPPATDPWAGTPMDDPAAFTDPGLWGYTDPTSGATGVGDVYQPGPATALGSSTPPSPINGGAPGTTFPGFGNIGPTGRPKPKPVVKPPNKKKKTRAQHFIGPAIRRPKRKAAPAPRTIINNRPVAPWGGSIANVPRIGAWGGSIANAPRVKLSAGRVL